ncbi:MAG: GGDEF domain-containing protein [Acidobacteriota bacterium]
MSSSDSPPSAVQDAPQPEADSQLDSRFPVERAVRKQPSFSLLLGAEPFMRVRVLRTLASILVFLLCALLIGFGIDSGWIHPDQGQGLSALMLTSCVGFYIAIRSGWSERFHEPALTLAQVLAAQTWICLAYAITNEAHGATLILFALVMFFGVFNMNGRSAIISGSYVMVVAGLTMLYKSETDPGRYPARLEFVNYVFVAVTVPVMAYLATQIAAMRNRLQAQKRDLAAALERIRELATRDELTGLINRRQLQSVLQEYKALLRRNSLEIWVTLVDLDHFKRVNDTWGHGVGDEVLKGFATQATLSLRSADVVARWGGEEFLIVMLEEPGANPNVGVERLRQHLAEAAISQSVPDLRMGFSAGLARCQRDEPIEVTIDRADAALYQAKAQGRNRSVVV